MREFLSNSSDRTQLVHCFVYLLASAVVFAACDRRIKMPHGGLLNTSAEREVTSYTG